KLTGGHGLRARYVIHAVGPVWSGGQRGEDEQLAGCYRRALELAEEHGVRTLAFPSISTGAYRFPIERAARIAISTVSAFLADHALPDTSRSSRSAPETKTSTAAPSPRPSKPLAPRPLPPAIPSTI